MRSAQRGLALLLVAQLVILALIHNPFARARTNPEQPLLPTLASITPERVEIANGEGISVTLDRRSGAWVLGQPSGYPLEAGRAEKLIQDLGHLTTGRQVASDKSSHAALKVADDQFDRRVRIWAQTSGTPAVVLYVGSSPGPGVTHLRVGGSDRVMETSGLSAYDAPAEAASWIERNLVPFQAEDVAGLEISNRKGRFALDSRAGTWRVRLPATRVSASLDQDKVRNLVRAVCGMSIDQPVGVADDRAQGLADPEATVTLRKRAAGPDSAKAAPVEVTVRVGAETGQPDTRYAARAGSGFAVSLKKVAFDQALTVDLKDLIKK